MVWGAAHAATRNGCMLYTEAIAAYVATRQPAEVTALLDQGYAAEASAMEMEIIKLQVASMDSQSW